MVEELTLFLAPDGSSDLRTTASGRGKDTRPHGPGQKPGETHAEFFARRKGSDETRQANASPADIAKRDSREHKARSYNRPCRPTEVYLWKPAGEEDPTLPDDLINLDLRVRVGYRAVGELWLIYPASHKVYNAWRDEWDICPMLAPADELWDPEEYFDDEDDDFLPGELPPAHQMVPSRVAEMQSTMYDTELGLFYGEGEAIQYQPLIDSFRSTLRQRYGLIPVPAGLPSLQYHKYGEEAIRIAFGLVIETMDTDAVSMVVCASAFLAAWETKPEDPWAPGILWDLEPTSNLYLPRFVASAGIRLQLRIHDNVKLVEVTYRDDQSRPWGLLVSPTTALQLCRSGPMGGLENAAYYLLNRGIRVAMPVRVDDRMVAIPSLTRPRILLGWRPSGFNPDGWDYKEYEAVARNLLTGGRARAALQRGGIVWRLAVELLGEEGIRDAARGPSLDMSRLGGDALTPRGNSWYEEMLRDDELDVICGVYHVYSRKWSRIKMRG